MTVTSGSDNLPATNDDFQDLDTGLEDFGYADAVIPRVSIEHSEGRFTDSLNNREFEKIEAIILGLVRQRVLWHHIVGAEKDVSPMCKSTDFQIGWPNMSDDQPKDKRFPWERSRFNPDDFPPDSDGQIQLPCERCFLKEWSSHPDGKKPYCSEQFTMPMLYREAGTEDPFVPAVVSFQKTSIKPLRAYLSDFKRKNAPTYTAITLIGLDLQSRGSNKYSVANFTAGGTTDSDEWRNYSNNYRNLRAFLQQPPVTREEDDSQPAASDNTARPPDDKAPETEPAVKTEPPKKTGSAAPSVTSPAAESVTTAEPSSSSPADDDELPF